jgi:predicted nucleic acid-binding Zn ribbon protein
MTKPNCTECGKPLPKGRRSFCSDRCYKRVEQQRYRAKLVPMTCAHCGEGFMGRRWGPGDAEHKRRYCSPKCDGDAKAQRYGSRCGHGIASSLQCPVCNFIDRCERGNGYRRVVRADPCAYCGQRPSSGLDHIDPRVSDRNDPSNWTGSCKRCNEIKRSLPMVLALSWIPLSREYHRERRKLFTPRTGG